MANIDNLNFGVILNDDDFNRKIEEDIEAAKRFNVQLSSLLDAKAKMPQFKVSVRTKEAEESLEKLNAKFAELEAADWTKVGKKLDVTHQVEQALIQLRNLEEEIEVIQEIRQEKGGDMGLALELKNAQEQADRLIASIAALREAEKAVNAPSQFQSHIRSLTEQSMEYKQLVEYMKAEEAAAAEVAKEKAKEEAARKKNTKAIEKERAAMAKGEFKEYIESLTAANPTLKQMSTYYKQLEKETAKNANAAKGAAVHQKRLNDQFKVTSRLGREVKNALIGIFSVHEASKLVSSLVRVTGEFELQKTTLAAMLGDLNEAEQIITRIQGLAVESPFQFKELTTYAKQLSAFSVPAEELYETTKMLADVSAGLGVGMDRIVLAYGQVRSAAFLRGQEVRQFTEAGIPILDELAKQFTELEGRAVSTGEVFDKISARLVPFEMVAKVFKDMTSEGGKFYNMQEVQAETLRGKLSNLKDAYEVMLNEIGSAHSDKLKGAVDGLRSLMQNWEAIGSQIVYLIKLFGAYKAAVGLLTISDTIAQFGGLTKALKQTAIAQKLLNSALLTNPYIAVGTAILGIVMALRNATKASREFKAEIDKIANTQYGEADKAVDRYNKLTNELKSATKGSHDYREAISKLNNEYGEYLPQLLDEKNALDLIKTSSDAVTASIYNRARARAYERSQQKTEDMYGESRDYYTSVFLQKLRDDGISEKAARDLFLNFNEAIKDQADGWNPAEVFNQVYKAYFSTTEDYFTEVGNALNDIKQNTPFIRNIYGENTTGWMTARDALWNYALVQNKVLEAEKEYNDILETRWGNGAKSDTESQKLSQIAAWYDKQTAAINAAGMSEQERIERLKNLDISKLQLLVQLYEELDKNPNTARTDLLNKYRDELSALTKQLDGWQKKVADALNPFGIKGKGAGDYGLFADESTSYLEYVNNLRNSYKGLAQQIADTAKANPKLNAELKKQKEVIEAVAKALNIDLMLSSNTTESNEEKKIKRLITSLRKLQTQYEKLKTLGVSDESIKTLFEGLYPELIAENGKDFVTDLKYIERAVELVADLEKIAPEDAKKILVDLGADEFSTLVKQLEKQNKAYKESAKAAGEYFNALRKWASEDFNINGEGIVLDVSKIASDLNEKIDEIELRATKAKEIFEQIDINSEEEISKVKELFVKEFGADAWEQFWDAYYTEGVAAIDALAEKQAQYERVLSQEKVNDLAEKYVKESYFTEGIKLTDLGDKTIFQLRDLKKKLQNMLNKEPLSIPAEIETRLADVGVSLDDLTNVSLDVIFEAFEHSGEPIDETTKSVIALIKQIQEAGLSTENFGKVIRKVFEGDLQELTEEEGKLLADMVMQYMDQLESLFKSIGEFAESTGNESLQSAAKGISEVLDVLGPMADKFAKGDWIGGIISGVTSLATKIFNVVAAQHELAKAIEETANQQRILNAEYAIMEGIEGAFGENTFKKFTNAYQEATKAYKDVQKDLERQNKVIFGGENNDANGWGIGGGIGAGAALGAAIGSIFPVIGTAIGAGIGALIGAFVGGITDVALEADNYAKSLKEMAEEIGAPLINEKTGGYNLETLKTIKDTYKNLSEEDAAWLDQAIANTEIYEKALTAMADYMSSVFGSVADDIADAFITSFKESGQAALDYADIMDSVASQIAKDIIKATLLQNIFTDELTEDAAKKLASGDTAGAMAIVDEAMKSAAALAPYIQEFLEQMEPYFQMEEEKPENTLGSGIKGITEDTANLLASYLNAIRADVSYSKTLWERMDANTQNIAAALAGFSAPSLMEYQAQIAANTYNTSISTQNILIELQSVMEFGDEGRAIRILS